MHRKGHLEWRTLLQLSGDEVGISEVVNKEDTHAKNQQHFMLPSRLIAKIYLFRTIFRGSGWSFANDPDFQHVSSSAKYWDNLNEKFFKKYYGIDKCHKRWADEVVAGRPIIGPMGRSWSIPMGRDYRGDLKIPWTTLVNYPVQGTGADIMMVARLSAHARLRKYKVPGVWVSTVHDSLVYDTPKENAQTITNIFHEVFDDLPKNIMRNFDVEWIVPLECEVKGGKNMKEMQKLSRNA